MPIYHPHKDEHGKLLQLTKPSTPTPLETWNGADNHATAVPGSPMPSAVNGIAVAPWTDAPTTRAGWQALVADCTFDEPPFHAPAGKKAASGVVVVEPDGRVWVISPSNQFGGYTNTFPKGTAAGSDTLDLRANAVKEAHEESGLRVELTGFLVDVVRSMSYTRYYVARRVGGCPSTMGWESQAVHLVPWALLPAVAAHKNDAPILAALKAHFATLRAAQAAGYWADDTYWTDALEQYSTVREMGNDLLVLDLRAIERILNNGGSPAYRLMEAMVSVSEQEQLDGFRGAPRLVLALLMRLAECGGHVARPVRD